MLQGIKGFVGSTTSHLLTGLGRQLGGHIVQRVAGPVPKGMEELLQLCQTTRTQEEVQHLAGRIQTLTLNPQNLAIKKTLEGWYALILSAQEEAIPQILQKIQNEIEQTILLQTPLIGHISSHMSQILNQALKVAPPHILDAKQQLSFKNRHQPFDKENLRQQLLLCRDKEVWSSEQKKILQMAVDCLSTDEGVVDWHGVQLLLSQKEAELNGAFAQSSENVRCKTQLLLSDCLSTVGTGLFKQADPLRTKIDNCMALLRSILNSQKPQMHQPTLMDTLENLVLFLEDVFQDDVHFQAHLKEFQELLVEKNSRELPPEKYFQRLYLNLQKFLPYFESSGVAVQFFETTSSLFFGNHQERRKGLHPLAIPYNFSQTNLIELQNSPRRITPKLKGVPLSLEAGGAQQATGSLDPPPVNLSFEIRSFLQENKTSLYLHFVGKMVEIPQNFSSKEKDFTKISNEISLSFIEGSCRVLPPLKEVLAKRFDKVYDTLIQKISNCWVPKILENLKGFDATGQGAANVSPLKNLIRTVNQLSRDLDSYGQSQTVLMREDYLKERRINNKRGFFSSLKTGWKIGGFLTDFLVEALKVQPTNPVNRAKKIQNPITAPFSKILDVTIAISNWLLKKALLATLRLSLSFIPYYLITEKVLDHLLTTQRLQKMYRSLTEAVLEDFRQGNRSLLDLELGKRVDSKVSKELVKSLIGLIPKNEGCDISGLKENPFMLLPSIARGFIYDKATEGVCMLWENMIHPKTGKMMETSLGNLLKKINSNTSPLDLELSVQIPLPIQDIEHALSTYIATEILKPKGTAGEEEMFLKLKEQILDLPDYDDNPFYFQQVFKQLVKDIMDAGQQKKPVIFGSNYHRVLHHLQLVHISLDSMQNPTEKVEILKKEAQNIQYEHPLEPQKMQHGDEAIAFAIHLGMYQIREWLTDREFFKRVLYDQLLPS